MRLKKGDTVMVISGREKGKTGKILEIDRKAMRARVEGVAIVKRHIKPGRMPSVPEGGIIDKPSSIHISNLMFVDPKTNEPTRLGVRIQEDGTKVRYAKRSGNIIE